jgi:hypothetical protein
MINMDRREMIGTLGSMGVGVAAAASPLAAADHHRPQRNCEELMGPVGSLHAHFCGIHIAKKNPKFQLVAQHYCSGRTEDMHQCLLYDSCDKNAKLLGVEYIVTDRVYQLLPETERKYWHPHTYEVLAGGLISTSMDAAEEMKFMKFILQTWGKTWHTWPDPKTDVPLGEPLLMWALTGDGQANEEVIAARDRQFGVSAAQIRQQRVQEIGLQVPQVPQPKSMDQPGRQWTTQGPDMPTRIDRR